MKDGKDINDIMEMPLSFMIDILEEKQEAKKEKGSSFFDLIG